MPKWKCRNCGAIKETTRNRPRKCDNCGMTNKEWMEKHGEPLFEKIED